MDPASQETKTHVHLVTLRCSTDIKNHFHDHKHACEWFSGQCYDAHCQDQSPNKERTEKHWNVCL